MSKLHIMDNDGNTEHFQLLMEQESAGTQRFFARIGGWLQALDNGSLLIVDEIERSMHPLLTTHDALLLDLNFLRRDQIWFAEKNENSCATELYPLSSFSPPRKGENIRKGYLQGRFGAIPFIGGEETWQG